MRILHGDPDVIEVRRTFKTAQECIDWERKVLRRSRVLTKDVWLNANIGGASIQTPEVRLKKGIKISETKRKRRQTAWNKGLTKDTDDRVNKYAKSLKNRKFSEQHKQAMCKPKSNKAEMGKYKRSEETKNKIRLALAKARTPEFILSLSNNAKANRRPCKHCGMVSNKSNVTRHERKCTGFNPQSFS